MDQAITVHNRQRKVRLNLPWLRKFAQHALEICNDRSHRVSTALSQLSQFEATIISDEQMADVHEQFLGARKPTDVISFDHGEILISADTALTQARDYNRPLDEEIGLYIIHGLLHLNGYDDTKAHEAEKMRDAQERIHTHCIERMSQNGSAKKSD